MLAIFVGILAPRSAKAEDAFVVFERPADGRTLSAEFVELDGDGRTDLLRIVARGFPPSETRWLKIYLQGPGGSLPQTPSFSLPLPEPSAAYDLADVRPTPGMELLLLQPDGVEILSLAGPEAPRWKLETTGATTLGAARDERGLERVRLVFEAGSGSDQWLGIPTFDGFLVLTLEGTQQARLDTAGRANFFMPRNSSLEFLESDIQFYYDAPHISVVDLDGDGRNDVVASNRFELRVFRRREDGGLPDAPDETIPLDIISRTDQIRGSGGVAIQLADIDADGRADLVATYLGGGFSDASMETRLHRNRGGSFDMTSPDQVFRSESTVGIDRLVDLDGDGQLELLRGRISFSLLDFVALLLTRSVDADFEVHRLGSDGRFDEEPALAREFEIPLSFDTFRPEGFLPVLGPDIDGDGYGDLLLSLGSDRFEVRYGGPLHRFERAHLEQTMDTRGLVRLGDWNADGKLDLLVFDPRDPEAGLRLALNRGRAGETTRDERRPGPRGRRP